MISVTIDGPTGTGARGRLKAYSSFEPYELETYLEALARVLPDVAIEIERMPTAILTKRLLAERPRPDADFIFGWADTASRTPGLERIWSEGRAGCCIEASGFSTAFVVDPQALETCGLGSATTWGALADRRLEGRIVFPAPDTSGAGFLALTTLLQFYGEPQGWELVEAIFQNVVECPGSAWEPARMTGQGSVAVGVTVRIAASKRVLQLPRLRCVNPADVVGVEAEIYGGLEHARHPELVRGVMDWIMSRQAREIFDRFDKIDLERLDQNCFVIDAALASAKREEWLKQFGSIVNKRNRRPR